MYLLLRAFNILIGTCFIMQFFSILRAVLRRSAPQLVPQYADCALLFVNKEKKKRRRLQITQREETKLISRKFFCKRALQNNN